ncbi:MAG: hypothetical protein AAFY81_05330, partial [Pseudomonadota bacterium]
MIKRALLIGTASLALSGCMTLSTDDDVARAAAESLPSLPQNWVVDGADPGDVRIGWIEAVG